MAWVLHFIEQSPKSGSLPAKEYVVLLNGEPGEVDKEPFEGYILSSSTDLDIDVLPDILPLETPLTPIPGL